MRTATSAARTCGASRSASEYTATVRRPSRCADRITRTAISLRLATSRVLIGRASAVLVIGRSHPEDSVGGLGDGHVGHGGEAHAQHPAGVDRVDHTVVPQPGRGVVRGALVLVLVADRCLEGLLVISAPLLAARLEAVASHGREDRRGLLAAHHRDPGVGPHPEETRVVGATAHAVVAGTAGAADDDRELRDDRAGDRGDELGAVTGDAAVLVLP